MISVFDCVENIVGKEENAGFQHFLFFPQRFQKASFSGSLEVEQCGKDNPLPDMPILGFKKFSRKCRYDVKNMDKWGYNYPIE